MKRLTFVFFAILLCLPLYADWDDQWDCDARHMSFGRGETYTASETFSVPAGSPLVVEAAKNGGIRVRGSNSGDFRITVCKAVGAWDAADAQRRLGEIQVRRESALGIDAPSGGDWVAHFLIEAPVGSSLTLGATNGPISVKDFEGDLDLEVRNGPIGLNRVSGTVVARAQNGPISLTGGAGEMTLHAQNGPLTIDLDESWNGTGLDGSTENGPLTLHLARNVVSGVVVETDGHSPVRCDPEVCDGAKTRWGDRGVRFEFGGATPVVKLSTDNGPLTIRGQ